MNVPGGSAPWGAPTPQPSTQEYGGVLKRLGARIIDGLIVGIPLIILFAVIPGLTVGGVVYNVVGTLVSFGYFVLLESSQGRTPGKQMLGMRVAGENGASPISAEASARRNLWVLISLVSGVGIIGLIAGLVSLGIVIAIAATISSDARNQGLHDRFGGTVVLDRA